MKTKQKYFENDSNVQKFLGIFSAHYCWPREEVSTEDSDEDDVKCWSQAMTDHNEWFLAKMWPKVVQKLPLITADVMSCDRMNQLLFSLVGNELDLLSAHQMQHMESVLDIFDDKITFGMKFWLKVCHHFNWRLTYSRLIGGHKHRDEWLQAIADHINDIAEDHKCFTAREIQYFFSIVDSVYVKTIALNVINGKQISVNEMFVSFMDNIWSEKSLRMQSTCRPIDRQLMTFNVLTQELIALTFKLISSECVCIETVEKQLKQLDEYFAQRLANFNAKDIDDKDWRILEDISTARDNQKSLDLVNKYLSKTTSLSIGLDSLQNIYHFLDTTTDPSIATNGLEYLTHILSDEQNENYSKLMDIVLTVDEMDEKMSNHLLQEIGCARIARHGHQWSLAHKVVLNADKPILFERWLTALVVKLNDAPAVELAERLNKMNLKTIAKVDKQVDDIREMFNQMTDEDHKLIQQLIRTVIIGAYLDPFPIYELLVELVLSQTKAQLPFVARLLANELYCLSTYVCDRYADSRPSLLMNMIVHKMVSELSVDRIDKLTALITHINACPVSEGQQPVLSLEKMFYYLIEDMKFINDDVVWLRLMLMRNIIELSGHQSWPSVCEQPVPTIAYLLQFVDHFWWKPSRKQLAIDLLDFVLKNKMTENLTQRQYESLELMVTSLVSKRQKASTHRIYLAYCEHRFPKPMDQMFDITKNIYHDQILHYAVICADFHWICNIYREYEEFESDMKIALIHILPALTAREWLRLYEFLRQYYYNSMVVHFLRCAITDNRKDWVDKPRLIAHLMDLIFDYVLKELRGEFESDDDPFNRHIRPYSEEQWKYLELDLTILFKTMAVLDYQMLARDLGLRLRSILVELAQRMHLELMDGYRCYSAAVRMPPIARDVLRLVFGYDNNTGADDDEEVQVRCIAAGAESSRANVNGNCNGLSKQLSNCKLKTTAANGTDDCGRDEEEVVEIWD